MEAVKEPPLLDSPMDGLKISVTCDESDENAEASKDMDVCHKSNGVADTESKKTVVSEPISTAKEDIKIEIESTKNIINTKIVDSNIQKLITEPVASCTAELDTTSLHSATDSIPEEKVEKLKEEPAPVEEEMKKEENSVENSTEPTSSKVLTIEESQVEVETVIESTVDGVTLQTEILVESNDNEIIETVCVERIDEQDPNNILSELGESIEFSEALRSSDITDNVENNNCAGRQEVFNKEELLDILEGNNVEQTGKIVSSNYKALRGDKMLEAQLALQQLTRLKKKPKKLKNIDRIPRRKSDKMILKHDKKREEKVLKQDRKTETTVPDDKEEPSIVKDLVKDWDDDDEREEKSQKLLEESEKLLQTCDGVVHNQVTKTKSDDTSNRHSVDSQSVDGQMSCNKSSDETQPQRRFGRVIKKKVIFDPDNPDTFTKTKVVVKSKESEQEKDQVPIKKLKPHPNQRSQSKSPTSKLQWKKPSPKNIKQNKRLTEIDRLLMDEGAVNMIYQLTPEAPKGKKNMKTKAEFIKKIQSSSTPDTKEMKFRERKKESRYEEGEARRISGGKQRPSLNSSVKSPSVSEDFEAHSADDSIIYRRHSSSSYSSSCMSPRRLSDVEISARNSQQLADVQSEVNNEINNYSPAMDNVTFMSDRSEVIGNETINKDDCLSIKEKLKSKLSLALNKRKHENSKTDKPLKHKKVMKLHENSTTGGDLKHLSIRFDGRLAILCVKKPGTISNVEALKDLEYALRLIDSRKDLSVTFLMPECLATYSELDLRSLLDEDIERRLSSAQGIADSVRNLLQAVEQHTKLLFTGVSSRCTGIGLGLVSLSDVALASERASFAIAVKSHGPGPIEPGISVLTGYRNLPQSMLNELIVFGRRLSAAEALRNDLVSRVLWPEKFNEQVLCIAKDIASQPAHNLWLKKKMLSINKRGSNSTFLECLEKERDLFIEYWTSDEGQDLLRNIHSATPANL